jgi:hypothetical protein
MGTSAAIQQESNDVDASKLYSLVQRCVA